MTNLRRTLIFLLQSATIGLALAFIVVWLRPSWFLDAAGPGGNGEVFSYATAVERAAPAVVNIHSNRRVTSARAPLFEDPLVERYFGDRSTPQSERIETSLGSGVLISTRGYILTNHHVIADAEAIQVALHDGRIASASVVGRDPDTDLALLHINLDDLPAIPIARGTDLRVGDVVLAIGNPFGIGQTVTQGIVSGTGRNYLGLNTFENFIQTDAAINPGNSGGALVNARGELIGINTAFYGQGGGSQGIGFAIPADLARGVMQQLVEHGRVIRGWLGVAPQDMTPELASAVGLQSARGVLVTAVQLESPAASAGIRPGDVITAIDDVEVADGRDALNRIAAMRPGTVVRLALWRDGTLRETRATIGERGG